MRVQQHHCSAFQSPASTAGAMMSPMILVPANSADGWRNVGCVALAWFAAGSTITSTRRAKNPAGRVKVTVLSMTSTVSRIASMSNLCLRAALTCCGPGSRGQHTGRPRPSRNHRFQRRRAASAATPHKGHGQQGQVQKRSLPNMAAISIRLPTSLHRNARAWQVQVVLGGRDR